MAQNLANEELKEKLQPQVQKSHKSVAIDAFLSTIFDEYAKEYGEHFRHAIDTFEKNLEKLKIDVNIQLKKEA